LKFCFKASYFSCLSLFLHFKGVKFWVVFESPEFDFCFIRVYEGLSGVLLFLDVELIGFERYFCLMRLGFQ
jgi:hypothetical protein